VKGEGGGKGGQVRPEKSIARVGKLKRGRKKRCKRYWAEREKGIPLGRACPFRRSIRGVRKYSNLRRREALSGYSPWIDK